MTDLSPEVDGVADSVGADADSDVSIDAGFAPSARADRSLDEHAVAPAADQLAAASDAPSSDGAPFDFEPEVGAVGVDAPPLDATREGDLFELWQPGTRLEASVQQASMSDREIVPARRSWWVAGMIVLAAIVVAGLLLAAALWFQGSDDDDGGDAETEGAAAIVQLFDPA